MNITAMILKDSKKIPEDIKKVLQELTGLRDKVIHEYNRVDDKILLESTESVLLYVLDFVELVEKWIEKDN